MNIDNIVGQAYEQLSMIAPRRPSFFTLEHMLVGKEVTHQAKLQRIMEEIRSKVQEIEGARDQIADALDQHRLMEIELEKQFPAEKISSETAEIQSRMALRRLNASGRQIATLREITKSRCEEVEFLIHLFKKMKDIEEPRDWDDPDVQREFYEAKLGQEIMIRQQLGMRPDMEIVRAVMALPPESNLKKVLEGRLPKEIK